MKNSNIAEDLEQGITNKSTSVQKMFDFENARCVYTNINTIKIEEDYQQTPKLEIFNILCKKQGDTLKKTTQVRYGNKRFILEDKYHIKSKKMMSFIKEKETKSQYLLQQISYQREEVPMEQEKKKISKTLLFKKNKINEGQIKNYEKRDTKNIAKNFIKAFMKYLDDYSHDGYKDVKKIVDQNNYNNHLIETIINNQQIGLLFNEFLKKEANHWIQTSRIKDKQIHKRAIEIYLQLYKNKAVKVIQQGSTNEKSFQQKSVSKDFDLIFKQDS